MGPCGGRGGAGLPPTVRPAAPRDCPGLRYEIDNVPPSRTPLWRPRNGSVLGRWPAQRGVRAHLCHNHTHGRAGAEDSAAPTGRWRAWMPGVQLTADGGVRACSAPWNPTDDGNLSLGRRIGVLVVLAALGGAIILAAGGVGGNNAVAPVGPADRDHVRPRSGPRGPTASPPTAAPQIAALEQDARQQPVHRPAGERAGAGYDPVRPGGAHLSQHPPAGIPGRHPGRPDQGQGRAPAARRQQADGDDSPTRAARDRARRS